MNEEKRCKTCKFCEDDGIDKWCVNGSSPFCAEYVFDTGTCNEWEQGNEYNKWKK